ncbi:MAG TPA: hypothetical protein VG603_09150, partial [Chitinophagales bacterium]|nr:hypothetical protein [Chitinophagales bacterium]
MKILAVVPPLLFSIAVNAQIFINTGNPDLEKYKKENPNAVIWDGGPNVPIPPNIPAEQPKPQTQPAVKTTYPKASATQNIQQPPVNSDNNNVPEQSEELPSSYQNTKEPVPDYPPDAIPGHCYARCMIPDQFEYKEEQVMDKPASVRT